MLQELGPAAIEGGFWADRQRLNRDVLIPDGARRLEAAGNFGNLRGERFRGMVFADSDVHKWLEALGHELAREPSPELSRMADETIGLLEAAQCEDGYLNSYYQVAKPGPRWSNLAWDHELYCAGHLFEAAAAHPRDQRLLGIARRFADLLVHVFRDAGTCGHPEAELGLVKLFRLTGERSYLELAQAFVDRRGSADLEPATHGSSYFQNRVPVREQDEVEGHAVRALYLAAGVTDLYMETGEAALLDAMYAQWRDMAGRKAYVTGGVGAHHTDEAFGDAYELPPDRCYGETCAAIASVLWNWRMLLVTGEARFADLLERTLYNGVLAGLALDGGGYSYVNPLHVREGHRDPVERGARRHPWYACACCPPNVMRLLASLQRYVATRDGDGVQIHQYATGRFGPVRVRTDYPWDGRVELEALEPGLSVSVRVPHWGSARLDGRPVKPGYVTLEHDTATLELDMTPRLVLPHPRIDAVRGCAAIERGPLVYCLEAADAPAGTVVDDLRLTGGLEAVARPDLLGGIVAVEADGTHAPADTWGWPYTPDAPHNGGRPVRLLAVPYALWGNRGEGAMRVWIPR
jgi:DUF1680 family protein